MSKNAPIVDVLLENINTDQNLLQEVEAKIEIAKDEKQAIVDRLKEQRKDISVLLKYADEAQQAKIAELGFDFSDPLRGINTIASVAFDLVVEAKDNQLSNGALYDGYVKNLSNKEEAVKYSAFNIKCRSLFNTQKLIRTKGKDPKSSREDIISLNGRVMPKEDVKPLVEDVKKPSAKTIEKITEKGKGTPVIDLKKTGSVAKKGSDEKR